MLSFEIDRFIGRIVRRPAVQRARRTFKRQRHNLAPATHDAVSGGSMFYSELTELYWEACCMQFDHSEYWEDRYCSNSEEYEWYLSYPAVAAVIEQHVRKDAPILHIGVGTSTMHEEMAAAGFQSITNVDYSKKCIQVLQDRWQSRRGDSTCDMSFQVADCRHMPTFEDHSYSAVLDKGTMDAMLCADDDTGNASKMLAEAYRVLCDGGVYVWCTSGLPNSRLPYFKYFGSHKLEVYAVGDTVSGPLTGAEASRITDAQYSRYYTYVLTRTDTGSP